jgi:ABC-type bacteriocin/lantibiotic exporter with double-glycine peptidase domain
MQLRRNQTGTTMISWPLAWVSIIAIICITIIVCAGKLWTDEWLQQWRADD